MYVSLPQGGHYVNFEYCRFEESHSNVQITSKNNIYIIYILSLAKPNETLRNLPKPPFPNFFATKPTEAQNGLLRCCIFAS